ncbi:hypothetical protein KR009_001760, partial [Drosophila setifemur]
ASQSTEFDDLCALNRWTIEDDSLFQACGFNVAHAGKSVFITWNEHYLLNFRFKKPNESSTVKITRVRIPLPSRAECYLCSVHTLRYNTMLLMSDGGIYCFLSFKALHAKKWLKGVHCFAVFDQGFSVIREEGNCLLLQTFLDLPSLETAESTLQHTFNITYNDQSMFLCDWQHDAYTLTTLNSSEKEKQFMQRLFGINAANHIHVFSIAGHVFALYANSHGGSKRAKESYYIKLLCVYAASVRFIRLLPDRNICLILLSSGSVDVWYVSCLHGIKQRKIHHTGSEWLDYDATSDNGDIYYTDGDHIVRLRLKYNCRHDEYNVETFVKTVPGIQVCTWLKQSQQLVCLSINNIFYRIVYEKIDGKACPLKDDFRNVTQHMCQNTIALKRYYRQKGLLYKALKKEYEKLQLISVGKGSIGELLKTSGEFNYLIPGINEKVESLKPAQIRCFPKNDIHVVLSLIPNNTQTPLPYTHWQLLICYDQHIYVQLFSLNIFMNRNCRIMVALETQKRKPMPHFGLYLLAFIDIQTQISAVLFPIAIEQCTSTYHSLFSENRTVEYLQMDGKIKYKKPSTLVIQQKIRLSSKLSISQITTLFNTIKNDSDNSIEFYCMDDKLRVQTCESFRETFGTLKSEVASAIYLFKQHLFLNKIKLD